MNQKKKRASQKTAGDEAGAPHLKRSKIKILGTFATPKTNRCIATSAAITLAKAILHRERRFGERENGDHRCRD